MSQINWVTCLVVAAILAQPLDAPAQSLPQVDPVWAARAASDGRAAYSRYLALRNSLDETIEAVQDTGIADSANRVTRRVVRLGNNIFFDITRVSSGQPKPKTTLQCDNPDYYFDLDRESGKTSYALTAYSTGRRKVPLENQSHGFHGQAYDCLQDVVEAAADQRTGKLRALNADPATSQLRVDFATRNSKGAYTKTIRIDPTKGWIVVATRIDTDRTSTTSDYTYGKMIEGVFLPTGTTVSTTYKAGDPSRIGKAEKIFVKVLDVKRTELTPADFRLSAFGLPEPGGAPSPRRPVPRYVWLLTATGICAAFAAAFAYMHRRSQDRRKAAETAGQAT